MMATRIACKDLSMSFTFPYAIFASLTLRCLCLDTRERNTRFFPQYDTSPYSFKVRSLFLMVVACIPVIDASLLIVKFFTMLVLVRFLTCRDMAIAFRRLLLPNISSASLYRKFLFIVPTIKVKVREHQVGTHALRLSTFL